MPKTTPTGLFKEFCAQYLDDLIRSGKKGAGRGVRGEDVYELTGTHVRELDFVKRPRSEYDRLQTEFHARPNGAKQQYLRHLNETYSDKQLSDLGLNAAQVAELRSGKVPKGYQVHHIEPLDDGGENVFSNFVLLKNHATHKLITNHQKFVVGDLAEGASKNVPWIYFPDGTDIWSDASRIIVP